MAFFTAWWSLPLIGSFYWGLSPIDSFYCQRAQYEQEYCIGHRSVTTQTNLILGSANVGVTPTMASAIARETKSARALSNPQ